MEEGGEVSQSTASPPHPVSPPRGAPGAQGSLERKGPETPPLRLQGPPLGEWPSWLQGASPSPPTQPSERKPVPAAGALATGRKELQAGPLQLLMQTAQEVPHLSRWPGLEGRSPGP